MDIELKKFGIEKKDRKKYLKVIFLIILVSVGSFFLLNKFSFALEGLKQYGYLGVFLSALAANATIVLPAPFMSFTILFAISLASQTNLIVVVLSYALGASLGEGVGYLIGRGGKRMLNDRENGLYQRVEKWVKKHGNWAIIILSFQPIFPFDFVGLAAGAIKYPWWKFLLFCFIGRIPKYLILIGGGFEIWKFFSDIFS